MNNKAAFHITSGNNMMRLCMLSVYSLRKVCTVPESIFDESLLWFLYKVFVLFLFLLTNLFELKVFRYSFP